MIKITPPQRITRILERLCPDNLFEGIIGDLEEQFYQDLGLVGVKQARRRFRWNALRFISPGIIFRNKFKLKYINTMLLLNYFKIGFRSIFKKKLYSFINAFGLSIAIAFCVMIYLFIQDEHSFDQFHSNKDRIYRIHKVKERIEPDADGNTISKSAYLQTGLSLTLKNEAPEVTHATSFNAGGSAIFTVDDKVINESITYVDEDFFQMFNFKAISGDYNQFLKDKSQIVLSESSARKYFGSQNPVNKDIGLTIGNQDKVFTVVGVIEDAPKNSSLDYHAGLIRVENGTYYQQNLDQWLSWNTPSFVMVENESQATQLRASLADLHNRLVDTEVERMIAENGWQPSTTTQYGLVKLTDIHLYPEVNWTKVSDSKYSYILSGIALLILVIACINYITLAMTSAAGKKLEVGIRKAVGSGRKQLIAQFMIESVQLAIIAMLLAIILISIFTPFFNDFTNKSITLTDNPASLIFALLGITLFLGVISGMYPAFFLSGFRPIAMLRSGNASKVKSTMARPLIILQFAISSFLVICSVIMFRQMDYITTKNLGYNKEQVLVIPTYTGWSDAGQQLVQRFKNESGDNPNIIKISGTSSSFSQGWSRNGYRVGDKEHIAYNYRIDPDYISTLGINIKAGRDFDESIVSDTKNTLIINEALVADLGWDDPLNQLLNWREDSIGGWKIIGVVEDFHFLSLENSIEPMFMHLDPEEGKITTMLVKISASNMPETITYLENKWRELVGNKPFDFDFLDENVASQYESYSKWSNIMGLTTLFAILIACLGLFGLAGISAVNRTKEIGIRKTLGAGMNDILVMMNKPFLIMALISFIMAVPASWWIMQQWLSDFKFAITLNWQIFAISLLSAVFFALLTVSYHSIKAVLINPAETLKYE